MWIELSKESKALLLGLKPPLNNNALDTKESMLHNTSAFDFINDIDDIFPDKQNEVVPHNDNDNTLLIKAQVWEERSVVRWP